MKQLLLLKEKFDIIMDEKLALSKTGIVLKYLLLISIVLNVLVVLSSVFVITEVSGVEDNVIHSLQLILADNSLLYTDPEAAPYAITQYAPLLYIVWDTILTILGISAAADPYLIKIFSRLISVLFVVLCAHILRKIFLQHAGLSKRDSNILVLGFISLSAPWLYIARPDVLLTFFTILVIWFLFEYFRTKRNSAIFLAGVVCFLAFFSKQNGAFLVGAVGLFLLLSRDLKGAVLFTIGAIAAALAGFLVMMLMNYYSPYLYKNIIRGIDNGTSIVSFVRVMDGVSVKYGIFIILSFIASIALFRSSQTKPEILTQYLFYFLLIVALGITFKIGSSENYFVDFLMTGLLLWAFFIRKFLYAEQYRLLKQWILLVLVAATISMSARNIFYYGFSNAYDWYFYYTHKEAYRAAEEFLNDELEEGYYFYSDDVLIQLMSPRQIMFPDNDIVTCCAYPFGTFSYHNFVKDVSSGKLRFIISFKPQLSQVYGAKMGQMHGVDLEQNFAVYKVIGAIYIYKNKHSD